MTSPTPSETRAYRPACSSSKSPRPPSWRTSTLHSPACGLKNLGLRIAIDDFGTGYSSLSYLRNLPVDTVKIDKSFIDRVTVDAEGTAMVRSVIDLTSALGLTSIAEGVEQHDQLALLDELGCDNVQGYLFAKPMPNDQFADALTRLRAEAAHHARPVRQSA